MKRQSIPAFYGLPAENGKAFSFTSVKEEFAWMGCATSCFQSDPLYGDNSDWQTEIKKSIIGKQSHIYWTQNEEQFPHMMSNPDLYFKRGQELNNNMFRISFEMAWICPRLNEFNEAVMAKFVRMLAQIKMRGMEPMVALYHWPIPSLLLAFDTQDNIVRGGWDNPDIIPYFRFYIESVMNFLADDSKVAQALDGLNLDEGDRDALIAEGLVRYFITINEPSSILAPCYLAGIFPPFKKWRFDLLEPVLCRLVEAHDIAYAAIKETLGKKGMQTYVGVGHQWHYCEGILKDLMQSRLPF